MRPTAGPNSACGISLASRHSPKRPVPVAALALDLARVECPTSHNTAEARGVGGRDGGGGGWVDHVWRGNVGI